MELNILIPIIIVTILMATLMIYTHLSTRVSEKRVEKFKKAEAQEVTLRKELEERLQKEVETLKAQLVEEREKKIEKGQHEIWPRQTVERKPLATAYEESNPLSSVESITFENADVDLLLQNLFVHHRRSEVEDTIRTINLFAGLSRKTWLHIYFLESYFLPAIHNYFSSPSIGGKEVFKLGLNEMVERLTELNKKIAEGKVADQKS